MYHKVQLASQGHRSDLCPQFGRFFQMKERHTCLTTEMRAGLVTFLTMVRRHDVTLHARAAAAAVTAAAPLA